MNNESFYMHPRYNEFKVFLSGLKTDARITPNALNLAFDVWIDSIKIKKHKKEAEESPLFEVLDYQKREYKTVDYMCIELDNQNTMLKAENDALKAMNAALTDANEILKQALNEVSE